MQAIRKNNLGASLIETVVYVTVLAILSVLVINTILIMFSAFTKAKILRRVSLDAETAFERISREVRLASSVNDSLSTLGTDPSYLVLNTVRSATDSTPVTKEFYLSNDRIVLKEGTDPVRYLTSPEVEVSFFMISKITTARSQALKITASLGRGTGNNEVKKSFFNTIILRRSY